jgi:hypothetical protein
MSIGIYLQLSSAAGVFACAAAFPLQFTEFRVFEKLVDRIGHSQRQSLPAVQNAQPQEIILKKR